MKKLTAVALTATMAAGLMACGGGDAASGSSASSGKSGSDEQITLHYMHFDQEETVNYLAERFMETHENIKVETTYVQVGTYNDTLLTMVANGETPDVIMFSDVDFALSNSLLQDISPYYDADPETANLMDTINEYGLGCFNTDKRYAVPVKFFPVMCTVDLNVLEKLNLEAPSTEWTWDEMINLIKNATQTVGGDSMKYYGLGYYNRLDSLYGIAASQDICGEFGFNGTTFDLSIWAKGEQEFSDLKLAGYVAPQSETQGAEDWTGDWDTWYGATEHVAVCSEPYWTYMNTWGTDSWKENFNIDVVPYAVPSVEKVDGVHNTISTMDFGGVSASCQYPEEAYELLKFMSFGIDGWQARIDAYNDESITNASGLPLKYDVMPAPLTKDENIWSQYKLLYTEGLDEEHVAYWDAYFANITRPIPYGFLAIPGYMTFCVDYFNTIGIHDLVDSGEKKAADYQDEATKKANWYHATAMIQYFGKDGYDVLSDEDIAMYEDIIAQNATE